LISCALWSIEEWRDQATERLRIKPQLLEIDKIKQFGWKDYNCRSLTVRWRLEMDRGQ
jgi:hypothetical protein